MKFKSNIEVQAGIKDKDGQTGSNGQILASTGSQVDWIDQDAIISAASKLVVIACKNTSGATITKGTPVYQTGTVGATDVIEVAEADSSDEDKMQAIGLLQTDIANNAFGNVVITGELLNFTTSPIDGVTPTTGDTIYVKPGGGLTLTKPTGVNFIQNVGLVGKVSGGNAGSLTVSSIMRSNDVPTPLYVDHDNQRLGIGITSPSETLDVQGNIKLRGTNNLTVGSTSDGGNFNISSGIRGFNFANNNGDLVRIDANGNVGIGTTSPVSPLHISSSNNILATFESTDAISEIRIKDSSKYTRLLTVGSDFKILPNDGVEMAIFEGDTGNTLFNGGNVGIGTTSPSEKLEVDGIIKVVHTDNSYANYRGQGVFFNRTENYLAPLADNTSTLNIGYNGAKWGNIEINGAFIKFENGPNEFMRIASSGNVGIGTTSPTQKLHVDGNTLISAERYYYVAGSGAGVGSDASGNLILRQNSADLMTTSGSNATFAGDITMTQSSGNNMLFINSSGGGAPVMYMQDPTRKWGQFVSSGDLFFKDETSNITSLKLDGGNGNATFAGNVSLPDNKNIKLGAGQDLELFHNGSHSYIQNSTGNLEIINYADDKDIIFKSDDGSGGTATYFRVDGGAVETRFLKSTRHFDNVGAYFGDSADLQIYHDGSNSYIDETGTGSLYIKSAGAIRLQSSTGENMIYAVNDGAVNLYYNNVNRLQTTNTGVNVTGGWITSGVSVATANVEHTDNTKALFGNGNDLEIYHNGSNSYIRDVGTGRLWIDSNGEGVSIISDGYSSTPMANFYKDGAVELFHNNSKKFETTSTGVNITGTAAATTFSGDLNGTINTATTATTKPNATNDTTVATTAFVQNLIGTIPAGLVFQGTWNAATNTPTLSSGSGTTGHFYIVSTDGSTDLDGITDWKVGDWAVFVEQGATDAWEKVDNSSVLDGSGTGQKVTMWSGSGTSNTLTNAPITVSGNDATFSGNVGMATGNSTGKFAVMSTGVHGSYDFYNNGTSYFNGSVVIDDTCLFSDNEQLRFGGANDFLIYHNSTTNVNHVSSQLDRQLSINANVIQLTNQANNSTYLKLESGTATFAGDVLVEDNLYLTDAGTVRGKIQLNASDRDDLDIKAVSLGSNMKFFTVDTERMRITSAGNVGIGTTSPVARLDVAGISAGPSVFDYAYTTNGGIRIHGDESAIDIVGTDSGSHSSTILLRNGNEGFGLLNNPTLNTLQFRSFTATADGFNIHHTGSGLSSLVDIITLEKTGNVGIGTTSPSEKLEVVGNIRIDSTSVAQMYLDSAANNDAVLNFQEAGVQKGKIGYDTSLAGLALVTGSGPFSSADMVVLNSGNVGIGDTSPTIISANTFSLSVNSARTDLSGGLITKANGTVKHQQYWDSTGYNFSLSANSGNFKFTGGNVGIGTTSPSARLDVRLSATTGKVAELHNNVGYGIGFTVESDGGVNTINSESNQALAFATNGSSNEKMRITSSGNVGIGTTSPSAKFEVFSTTTNKFVRFRADNNEQRFEFYVGASGNASRMSMHNDAATETIRFASAGNSYFNGGNVGIGTTSPTAAKLVVDSGTAPQILVKNTAGSNAKILFEDSSGLTQNASITFDESAQNTLTIATGYQSSTDLNRINIAPAGDVGLTVRGGTGSSSGNVGIGETSPDFRLDVSKGYTSGNGKVAKFRSGNDATFVNFDTVQVVQQDVPCLAIIETSTGTQSDEQKLTFAVGDNKAIIGSTSTVTNGMSFYTNRAVTTTGFTPQGNLALHLANNGNVGIGTTSPTQKLDVNGYARATSGFVGSSGLKLFGDSSSTNFAFVSTDGNVGIGTNNPVEKLQINSGDVLINNSSVSTLKSGGSLYLDLNTFGSLGGRNFRVQNNGTVHLNIDSTGVIKFNAYDGTNNTGSPTHILGTDASGNVVKSTAGSSIGPWLPLAAGSGDPLTGDLYLKTTNDASIAREKIIWQTSQGTNRSFIRVGGSYASNDLEFGTGDSTLGMILHANAGLSIGATVATTLPPASGLLVQGSVGIGTTSPSSNSKLEVIGKGDQLGSTGFYINSSFKDDTNVGVFICHDDTVNTTGAIAGINQLSFITYGGTSPAWGERMKITGAGNVGIGTTSPGAKLQVYSTATRDISIFGHGTQAQNNWQAEHAFFISAGQGVMISKANASNNTNRLHLFYSTSNGDAQYMLHDTSSNDKVKLNTNGNSHFNGGNVGIGTTSPDNTLDVVASDVNITPNAESSAVFRRNGNNYLTILSNASNEGGILFGNAVDDNDGSISYKHNTQSMQFATADAERMRITSGGNVGIGTTGPSSKLSIYDSAFSDTAGTGIIELGTGSTKYWNFRLASTAAADLVIDRTYSGTSSEVFRVQRSTGNVGIGTSSPGYPLEVDGGAGSGIKIKAGNASNDDSFLVSNNNDASKFLVQGDGKVIINSSAGISGRTENFQVFGKQIITNTGTSGPVLYLGYNSSGSNTIQLGRGRTADGLSYMDFNGEVMSAGQFGFRIIRYSGQNASTELNQVGTGAFKITCSNSADIILNPNSGSVGISQTNPSYKLDVSGNGRFTSTVTAANFILSSDERLKENVEKVCDNKVEADWKTFELKTEKGQKRYGVIAQELEKTNPEFVREDSQGFKSVAYIDLLIAKIAELEARLEKLEK